MARMRQDKTNFTSGEISRDLLGRSDLKAYDNGALSLRNVFIQPTGGVVRRAGLAHVAVAPGDGRLVAFEFNTEQTYLLVFTNERIDIWQGATLEATVPAPWTLAQLPHLAWTQSADTLLLCHPDVPSQKLTRTGATTWTLTPWSFFTEAGAIHQPYYRFGDATVTVTPSATSGLITVTASAPVFQTGHEGGRLRIGGKQITVTAVSSATQLQGTVVETLAGTGATANWDEQAFSTLRGWPVSVCFHQHRLVIGGSRDLPNRLWLSGSGDLWNFNLGTGLDDEAIEFGILSDQVNAIRAVFSGRHLQVFTSGAEWMVSGDPLTPQNIQLNRQTRVGSAVDRVVAPRDVDGATLFVSRNGREIREFLFTYTEQAYQASDLALLSRHLVQGPRDQDYDQGRRLLFVVMDDGSVGVLTVFRTEQVSAWTRLETDGLVRSLAVVGDEVYALTQRGAAWHIESFDDEMNMDAAVIGTSPTPAQVWSGMDHLEGRTVQVVADGAVVGAHTVTAGRITLTTAASSVQAGLPYTHIIEPLPPNMLGQSGAGGPVRLVELMFRLEKTAAVRVDLGQGLFDLPLHQFGTTPTDGSAPVPVSGDRRLRALGWVREQSRPLWRIEQSLPLPFKLLSVSTELRVKD